MSGATTLPKPSQFRAKHKRPDGTPTLRIEVPVHFSLDEAAEALAIVYPEMPIKFGKQTARVGITEAAKLRLRGRLPTPDPAATSTYRAKLIELAIYDDPAG